MQKRDSVSVPRGTQKCEQEDWATVSGSERIAPYRRDQSRVEAYTPGVFPDVYFYPVPSAAARTAPNGVKERASFCLVFRSLNTTSSHRIFSMGYRRAKSTQGNTNFRKKNFFWQTTPGSLPAGLKHFVQKSCRKTRLRNRATFLPTALSWFIHSTVLKWLNTSLQGFFYYFIKISNESQQTNTDCFVAPLSADRRDRSYSF